MKNAILIIDNKKESRLAVLIEILKEKYDFDFQSDKSISYQSQIDGDDFFSFLEGGIEHDYEKEELDYIYEFFDAPSFYYVEFYKLSLFRDIVQMLSKHLRVMIDDDKGHIYDVPAFLDMKSW